MSVIPLFFFISVLLTQVYSDGLEPHAADITDGRCRTVAPYANLPGTAHFVTDASVYSVFLASQSNLRVNAATFLGRPAQDEEELMEMCFNVIHIQPLTILSGYINQTFVQASVPDPNNPGTIKYYKVLDHSDGVVMCYQKSNHETIIWSDEKEHVLFVRCINHEFMDWKMISRVVPTDEVMNAAIAALEERKFNTSLAVDLRNFQTNNCNYNVIPTLAESVTQILKNLKQIPQDL